MFDGFNKHYRIFRECGVKAKVMFEAGDAGGVQKLARDRIQFYDDRVREAVQILKTDFDAESLSDSIWQQAKLIYVGLLINHKQPDCAETFFNSVCCKILHRTYFHNEFIFFRPGISTEYLGSDPPSYRVYYPNDPSMRDALHQMFADFGWKQPFVDLDRDITRIGQMVTRHFSQTGGLAAIEANFQLQILSSAFYRNKAAYIVGKVVNGDTEQPFVIPILRGSNGSLYVDTILLDDANINILFSLNRAYFLVDTEVPSAYVQFLNDIMPMKLKADLYTMLGLQKQGKTRFYRDLDFHLHHSRDKFVIAPGIPGMVMVVFTLPSFPYVFKMIKDRIPPPKTTTRKKVQSKYLLVKRHERVGRMSDTLEFSQVAFPKSRFDPKLIEELRASVPSQIEEDDTEIVIKHVYIERRVIPLDLYIKAARDEHEIEHAVLEFGNTIKELASANIFPGDMLWKNFGVTRFGRVIFYDYDEIEYLTDCNFRRIPPPPYPEYETMGEPWFSVGIHDIFPEEFEHFIIGSPKTREMFMENHADLLTPEYWWNLQEKIKAGVAIDFFPYSDSVRFCNVFSSVEEKAEASASSAAV